MTTRYQVLVIGGGHAGIEAAAAAARIGAHTAMVTMDRTFIGEMSCNPAIGGLAKGQIAREVDALGGLMGRAADHAGIQFRVLNASKGPAVRAPRAQQDKTEYREFMQEALAEYANLDIVEAEVKAIEWDGNHVTGVATTAGSIVADTVVISSGTFLNGLIHTGEDREEAGRMGEPAAVGLSASLEQMGFILRRLKTGTPPRIHRDSIDFSKFLEQPGDENPIPFSFINSTIKKEQICCWVGYTNEAVHEMLHENIDRSPLFSGAIKGIGPRYCPSIEDKVVKFPEKTRHQLFLEPEHRDGESIYVNGISTSMPLDIQKEAFALIPGLENAEFIRPGYAIEYDSIDPLQLRQTMAAKDYGNLYFCGQINGTSGYEEAAGQGLVAGANAALLALGKEPLLLSRESSYIGVMVNDLITTGADEPYRMFTSRAENRLALRADNADRRLTPVGREYGIVDDLRWQRYQEKLATFDELSKLLDARRVMNTAEAESFGIQLRGGLKNAAVASHLLRRPEVSAEMLLELVPELAELSAEERLSLATDIKYEGYVKRQVEHAQQVRNQRERRLPADIDYTEIPGLSLEMRDRLTRVKPENIGQAEAIPGLTPAALAALTIYLARMAR